MTSSGVQTMGARDWLLLIILAGCFSGSFLFNRIALQDLGPLTVVLGRVAVGAAVLNLVLRLRGETLPRGWTMWRQFLIMGALSNAIPFVLIVTAQTRIPSGLASILNAMTPLTTILVARVVAKEESLTRNRVAGVVLGLGGAAIVIGPASLLRLSSDVTAIVAQLAVLAATFSYAFAVVYGRGFRALAPLTAAAGQLTGATFLLLPITLLVDQPWTGGTPSHATAAAVLGLGVVCSAIAYVLFFRILAASGPTNLALVTFLIPVGALFLGSSLLHEQIELRHILGMSVIFSGLATVDGRLPAAVARISSYGWKPLRSIQEWGSS